jgi:regulator of RNase E activity RraB
MARFYSRTRIPDIEQESDMTSGILESFLTPLTGWSAAFPPRDPDDDDDEDDEDEGDESDPDEPPVVREPDEDE